MTALLNIGCNFWHRGFLICGRECRLNVLKADLKPLVQIPGARRGYISNLMLYVFFSTPRRTLRVFFRFQKSTCLACGGLGVEDLNRQTLVSSSNVHQDAIARPLPSSKKLYISEC